MAKAAEKTVDDVVTEHMMGDAPKDGRWIELSENGIDWVRARWYETRVRAVGSIAWVKASCWSTSEPSKLAHCVRNPKGWRPC